MEEKELTQEDVMRYQQEGDKHTVAEFFRKPKYMDFQSKQAKREITEYRDYVRIKVPGSKDINIFEVNRNFEDTGYPARFPKAWADYKNGVESKITGFPVDNLHDLDENQIARLKTFNIMSVEQLADLNDAGIADLGRGARDMVAVAKKFMSEVKEQKISAQENAVEKVQRLEAEKESKDAEIAEMKAMLAELMADKKKAKTKKGAKDELADDSAENGEADAAV